MGSSGTSRGAYARHDPTQTPLHGLVAKHLETFARFAEERSGKALPRYVVEEFRAYLRCGVLAHGFGRARCAGCGHDMFVAFSCKLRGVCPSCGGRRMSETAAHLVDRVSPAVPVRQWVLHDASAPRVFDDGLRGTARLFAGREKGRAQAADVAVDIEYGAAHELPFRSVLRDVGAVMP